MYCVHFGALPSPDMSSHVLHRLKFLKINFGHSSQRRVAVVKPTVNKRMYKRMESL